MRIGIDARSVVLKGSGVGSYTYNLITNLCEVDRKNEYLLFCNSFRNTRGFSILKPAKTANSLLKLRRIPNDWLNCCWYWLRSPPIESLIGRIDLFHSTGQLLPPQLFGFSIDTIHDLSPIKYPQYHTPSNVVANRRKYRMASRSAHLIIASSESTKRDIATLLTIPEERVRVVYLGRGDEYRPIENRELVESFLKVHDLRTGYLLYLGTIEPRKNLERLVDAYDLLREKHHLPHKLVIAGARGWLCDSLFEKAEKSIHRDGIVFTNHILSEDLPLLVNGADLFVYPSLYEGFGLPVLEAMACGIPVVTSNVSSIPEVVSDAALLIDPYQVDELSDAIDKVLTDDSLRGKMIEKGLKRAKLFSWKRTARETLKVYEEAVKRAM